MVNRHRSLAIIGGGPSALFIYKQLLEEAKADFTVSIFESNKELGKGMPYSKLGANMEHVTNVSGNEIPELIKPVIAWIKTLPDSVLQEYNLERDRLHEYMVLPRLLFGDYLYNQFNDIVRKGQGKGIKTEIYLSCTVTDIRDIPENNKVLVTASGQHSLEFDRVIICSGHVWPLVEEGRIPGYYNSPYPPAKLNSIMDHEVAIRGSSLTAIDAIRTLARLHGRFNLLGNRLVYHINDEESRFRIILHSKQGLLPALRFHLNDPKSGKDAMLSQEEILEHMVGNDGFLSLDFIFEKNFKDAFRVKDAAFYEQIKSMGMEEFVEAMMHRRQLADPFKLFKQEYDEAAESIRERESVYWKEMLATLSFAMNYPAKHFSAEDMLRLQKILQPLIAVVIAFIPQNSAEELMALYEAGRLDLIAVGADSKVEAQTQGGVVYNYRDEAGKEQKKFFKTYIDCTGQQHLSWQQFPFKSLVTDGSVTAAKIKFRSSASVNELEQPHENNIQQGDDDSFFLNVPGIAITDKFRVIDKAGAVNPRIYVMAVSCIGGFNPDYSGLDFCEAAAKIIIGDLSRS